MSDVREEAVAEPGSRWDRAFFSRSCPPRFTFFTLRSYVIRFDVILVGDQFLGARSGWGAVRRNPQKAKVLYRRLEPTVLKPLCLERRLQPAASRPG